MPVGELLKLYDTTTDPQMKETLVNIYIRSGEKPAVDKLLSIVKDETNVTIRKRTISRLSSSENPRIKQALADLIVR